MLRDISFPTVEAIPQDIYFPLINLEDVMGNKAKTDDLKSTIEAADGRIAFVVHPYFLKANGKIRGYSDEDMEKFVRDITRLINHLVDTNIPIVFFESFEQTSSNHIRNQGLFSTRPQYIVATEAGNPDPKSGRKLSEISEFLRENGATHALAAGSYLWPSAYTDSLTDMSLTDMERHISGCVAFVARSFADSPLVELKFSSAVFPGLRRLTPGNLI